MKRLDLLNDLSKLDIRSEILRRSFSKFAKEAWRHVCQEKLIWELPQEAISIHLQALADRKLGTDPTLVINVPPGSSKSMLSTVLYPAWLWTRDSTMSFIIATHTSRLTNKFAVKFGDLIKSKWYADMFGVELKIDNMTYMKNKTGGERFSTSVGGSVTGDHANLFICDDLVDAKETLGMGSAIEAANSWHERVTSTRFKPGVYTSELVIAQRLSVDDLPGLLEKQEQANVTMLSLPAVLDVAPCSTKVWTDTRKEGELLSPILLPQHKLDYRKLKLGTFDFEAQYQQRPSPRTGGYVKREWLERFYQDNEKPRFDKTALIADCANTGKGDPTGVLIVGIKGPKMYALDYFCKKIDVPEALRVIRSYIERYSPSETCIESAAAGGHTAIQMFKKEFSNIIELTPKGSKLERLLSATPSLEGGSFFFPARATWTTDFIDEVCSFTQAQKGHDEAVDCLSYAVNRYLTKKSNVTDWVKFGKGAAALGFK
jgi:predicted phage terminase large subunit-like protein